MPSFPDTSFTLFKDTDDTQVIRFIVGSSSAGYRDITVPGTGTMALTTDISTYAQPLDADLTELAAISNVRGDIAITNSTPAWVRLAVGTAGYLLTSDGTDTAWAAPVFKDNAFTVGDDGDITKSLVFSLGGATTNKRMTITSSHTLDRTITLPNATVTLAHISAPPQTFAGACTFSGNATYNGTASYGSTFQVSGSANFTNVFQVSGTTGISLLDNVSGIGPNLLAASSAANAFTATVPDLPNASTFIMKTGTDIDATNQATSIATANLIASPNAGMYAVDVIALCTTAGSGGTLTVTIGWTDPIGATTSTPVNLLTLAATGRASGTVLLRSSSGAITYATTVTAPVGSPKYALYIRIRAL